MVEVFASVAEDTRPCRSPPASPVRAGNAVGLDGRSAKPYGVGEAEGNQQAA